MQIANRKIGIGQPCFVVAEISANHNQNFEKAAALIKAAAKAGADAVKLQTYTPDTITINCDKDHFLVGGKDNPKDWQKKTLYQLYQTAYTPWEWQPKLKKIADDLGIILFSTPFDETAVDFLEEMKVPCYKVAAYEATDFLLLRKIARTKKPIIVSVGYSSEEEVAFSVKTLRDYGATDIALLHCVTQYSENPLLEQMNLKNIRDLKDKFGVVSGFSDNNAGIEVPVLAAAAGASIIEKHFILDRSEGGPDAQFSIEPKELANMIAIIKTEKTADPEKLKKALGEVHYGPASEIEEHNKKFRRSLFAVRGIKKGEPFTKENIRSIRPAFGLETKYFDQVIGKLAAQDIEFGTPLKWEHLA